MGETETRGLGLSETLKIDLSTDKSTIFAELDPVGNSNIVMSGKWDGKLIRGLIRAIEHQYKIIKLNARRDSLAKRFEEAKNVSGSI
jgi:hypothetical protein